jgi:teichuronic acid biosynthesis glycosyltransferase TuaG
MKTPTISICLPTYNRAEYIAESINSVLNQTYTDWEMIIVDDGSTDSTDKVLAYYTKKYPKIKSVKTKNQGIAAARNKALSLATGRYIAVMDSDDLMSPERLEKELKALKEHNADFVYSHYLQANDHAEVQGGIEAPDTLTIPNVLEGFTAPHVTILAKRKCFDEHPYRPEFTTNDDLPLVLDWLKAGYTYKLVPDALMIVRYHETSVSKTKDKEIKAFTEQMRKEYATY